MAFSSCLLLVFHAAAPLSLAQTKPLEQQIKKRSVTNKGKVNPAPRRPAAPGQSSRLPKQPQRALPAAKTPGRLKTGPTQPIKLGADEMLFNFQDADIKAVIKTIARITGKNFVLDPRVKGKISIISSKPVSKTAAYQIFLSAIKAQGFTTARVNRSTLKIIPVGEGKQNAALKRQDISRGGEQMISQVIVVQHGSATEMVPLLRPLMAPTSQLSAYSPANALILTDYSDNIRRILELIGEIDKPISTDVTVIPLLHASALDIAQLIDRLLTHGTGGGIRPGGKGALGGSVGSRTSIIPDLRTNSLLIRSDNPGRVAQVKKLIEKLDVPAKTEGNTRVIYLKNADATKLAEILRGLLEAGNVSGQKRAVVTPRARGGAQASTSHFQKSLIQADEATNSLIISASDAVYNNLRGVIEKLDARRAQVFVEALIAEIHTDKASEFGFQWAGAKELNNGGLVGGLTNFTAGTSLVGVAADPTSLASVSGLTLAFLGKEITLSDGSTIRGLGGLARALVSRSLGNILSTPNLLTLDNAEAKITVGQNVPFLTGSFTQSATGAANPFQTIERKDVGLTLKIKPSISEGGSVKLEIHTEVSSVSPIAGGIDLITNKRTLDTTVMVEDRHTIVLGGLMDETEEETVQGVPILSHIPILGWLFKYKKKSKRKTNLMIFLRPTVIRNQATGNQLTLDRYKYIMGDQKESELIKNLNKSFSPDHNPPPQELYNPEDNYEDDLPLGPEDLEFDSETLPDDEEPSEATADSNEQA